MTQTETATFTCEVCGGPLGQQRWRGFPPICSKCEMESIHDTPDVSGPYLDAYTRLRDIRNQLADVFRQLEDDGMEIVEGEPVAEVIDQIEDLAETFMDAVVREE